MEVGYLCRLIDARINDCVMVECNQGGPNSQEMRPPRGCFNSCIATPCEYFVGVHSLRYYCLGTSFATS